MCMKKIKTDLVVLNKLNDVEYYKRIVKAYEVFKDLDITTIQEYYSYQICWKEGAFKEIYYEEILSYEKLLDTEHKKSIELLNAELKSKCKVITFPKIN